MGPGNLRAEAFVALHTANPVIKIGVLLGSSLFPFSGPSPLLIYVVFIARRIAT
jgi:hypothetical protein